MINELRDYQKKAIADTYSWLSCHSGNPCIVAPTGSGKSHIIAGLCEDIMSRWRQSRIIILSHVKELLIQDAEKLLNAWPEAPLGIYSAGLGRKDIDAITVAGIQFIWRLVSSNKNLKTGSTDLSTNVDEDSRANFEHCDVSRLADEIGRIDLAIVDECHLINTNDCGMYRNFLNGLKEINPYLRVIGLTATPYRLGQGMITEGKDRLFDGLIESISIEELVERGYLARLRSKFTDMKLDVSGVRKRNGDFMDGDLQSKIDTEDNNARIVSETISRAESRRAWLVFATGVEHAFHLRDEFRRQGIAAETVIGNTPKDERARILEDFKTGRIRATTNVGVLTTGYDYPNIDLIVMARPTLSPGLYMQMAGRGMRVKNGPYSDCLVLDFAGNIARHGPVTVIQPPTSKPKEEGEVPVKECPECHEAVAISTRVCPCCGHVFPVVENDKGKDFRLNETEDIMGSPTRMEVRGWNWRVVTSKKTGISMIRVDFYPKNFMEPTVPLFLCLLHDGYAGEKAQKLLWDLAELDFDPSDEDDLREIASSADTRQPPLWIEYRRNGRYHNVTRWGWGSES